MFSTFCCGYWYCPGRRACSGAGKQFPNRNSNKTPNHNGVRDRWRSHHRIRRKPASCACRAYCTIIVSTLMPGMQWPRSCPYVGLAHRWVHMGPSSQHAPSRLGLCGAHSYCRTSIPGHSIAAVRALKSSLSATAGGEQGACNAARNDHCRPVREHCGVLDGFQAPFLLPWPTCCS